jgi:hypothetical protein
MEENKYYIPEIEELYIGLDCEIYGQNTNKLIRNISWHPVKVWYGPEISKLVGILQCNKLIKTHHIRLKYLDREDIESLGFDLDQKTKDGYCFIYGNMFSGDYILTTKDFKTIDITNMIGNKNDISFSGIIKNKSELKKLMKQLNII